MRKFFTLILITVVSFPGFAFKSDSGLKIEKNSIQFVKHNPIKGLNILEAKINHKPEVEWNKKNSSPVFVGGTLTSSNYAVSSDKSLDGKRFLSENAELFGIRDPYKELKVISNFKDKLSKTHIKYQQQINGIKIFDGQLIVHINTNGSIESVNGRYYPTPDINLTPKLDNVTAINKAKAKVGNYKSDTEKAELIIYTRNGQFKLAYEVKLVSYWTPNMTVFVDAQDGSILKVDDGIRYDGPKLGSGIDLYGQVKPVNSYLSVGDYIMIDASLPMYKSQIENYQSYGCVVSFDAQNDTAKSGYEKAGLILDPNRDNNFNDNVRLKAAVSAHNAANTIYKFFKSQFNRNSYNDSGASILNVLHFKENYNNAFWNGICLTYGDGDGVRFSNLAGAFDVITHEFTHAVTSSTANLVYELESGAINESVSDVFASLADSTNWLIGEDVTTPNIPGDALRSMADPHNGGNGPGDGDWQPANMSELVQLPNDEPHDWGGVHINSGIPNKAFYNVASVIGHWKSGQIWYRSLTTYLTNNSQFSDLRTACLNSAKDLYGEGSGEYTAVDEGFKAVGIYGSESQITTDLIYDDGNPLLKIWQSKTDAGLAVKFTSPIASGQISKISYYYFNDVAKGSGRCYIAVYSADKTTGQPAAPILDPYETIFTDDNGSPAWNTYNLTDANIDGNFYVALIYDGFNQPAIGANDDANNLRAYETDGVSWSQIPYELFIRATVTNITGVTEIDSKVPDKFEISSNYPNPFNPTTSIRYSLPLAENVNITIYDLNGKEIAKLVDNLQNAGTYVVTWNGKNNSGSQVSSGVYFYRIQAGNFVQTNKMMLLK